MLEVGYFQLAQRSLGMAGEDSEGKSIASLGCRVQPEQEGRLELSKWCPVSTSASSDVQFWSLSPFLSNDFLTATHPFRPIVLSRLLSQRVVAQLYLGSNQNLKLQLAEHGCVSCVPFHSQLRSCWWASITTDSFAQKCMCTWVF